MNNSPLIIFDTEFTAWPGSMQRDWSEPWEFKEVIQLAALKVEVHPQGVEILESFNEIIRPQRNPQLSDYIIQLTGIEQTMVDELGVDFPSALKAFYRFADQGSLTCYAWGADEQVLRHNCQLSDCDMPDFEAGMVNLRDRIHQSGLQVAHLCSGELAGHLGLALEGHVHNALFDVRSIAAALDHWTKAGNLDWQA